MNEQEFKEKHKELITKYGVCFADNCDLWSAVDGFNYYENEDDEDSYIFTATGITYSADGQGLECGDFEDYLNILANGLKEHFNF